MREILFRGKMGKGDWIYGCYVLTPDDGPVIMTCADWGGKFSHPVIPATVGQYTGHFSKEKAKVFEGDILKDLSETDPRYKDAIYVIVWDKENARFALNYHDTLGYKNSPRKLIETNGFKDVFKLEEWARIIGNIHDNPELLKEEESK